MRILLTLAVLGLLGLPADAAPQKEWQPLIDASINALKKKDAAALDKLLVSFAEANAACNNANTLEAKGTEELDKKRPKRIATALQDCSIMDWNAAKFVSASGGEPSPTKCEKFKPSKVISVVYEEGSLVWTVALEPVVLNGKHLLLGPPRCISSMKK
jgi:hypothetical protein